MVAVDEPVRSTRLIFTVAQEAADSAAAAIQSAIQSVGGATDSSFPTQSMVFGLMAPTLPQFYDAWSVDMHEPGGSTQTSDHGFTFREPQKGTLKREDKVLAPLGSQSTLRAHQISTPIRTYSDRWALLAHLQIKQPNCTPNEALLFANLQNKNPNDPTVRRSPSFVIQQPISQPDGYVWVFVDKPGTFSEFKDASVEVSAFAVSDLTNPLLPKKSISINDIPAGSLPPVDFVNAVNPSGQTFSSREPFLFRIRPATPNGTIAKFTVIIVKHIGDSIATAIELEPHVTVDPELPNGKLGDTGACFFRLSAPERFSGQSYDEKIVGSNNGSDQFALQEIDPTTLQPVLNSPQLSNAQTFSVTVKAPGIHFVRLIRSTETATRVTVSYPSIVRYLYLDESLSAFVDEETGLDSFGAEEFKLKLTIDGKPLGEWTWHDADNHETWNTLTTAVTQTAKTSLGRDVRLLAFCGDVTAEYWKSDVTSVKTCILGNSQDRTKADLERYHTQSDIRRLRFLTASQRLGLSYLNFRFCRYEQRFGKFIADNTEKWGKVIKSAGIKPESTTCN